MKHLLPLIALGLGALLPGAAIAGPFQTVPYETKPRPELYVFGYGGLNWITSFEGAGATGNPLLDLETENGWGAGGGIGLRSDWLGGTRFEVEGFHRSNEVDDLLWNGVQVGSDAEAEVTGVSVNFVKELVIGALYPYVGIGLGYGDTDVDLESPIAVINDSSSAFLWQVIAGLDFPYTQRTSLFLEYRFMPLSDFNLLTQPAGNPNFEANFDDVTNHSVFFGLRYAF